MRNLFWKTLARALARPAVVNSLIARAKKTPYSHISKDGAVYMERYWLFNPYPQSRPDGKQGFMRFLPSIRLHRIMREDRDDHMHDHPWDARTIILQGSYVERRVVQQHDLGCITKCFIRAAGDTTPINFGEYHKIISVSEGGVWTMFITWKYRGVWGFLVKGTKIKWKDYLSGNYFE